MEVGERQTATSSNTENGRSGDNVNSCPPTTAGKDLSYSIQTSVHETQVHLVDPSTLPSIFTQQSTAWLCFYSQ